MKSKNTVIYTLLLVLGVIVLVNILSFRFFHRFDLTKDNQYTLSKATKNVLRKLTETVTVTAYFSENLPPELDNVRRDFKDILLEYSNISKGKIVYEFIDPLKDEDIETKIQQEGITQLPIEVREKDEIKVQKAYMGAKVQLGEKTDIISVLQSNTGMEYALTSSIKKLSVSEKPKIGLLKGHGEAEMNQLMHVVYGLSILYDVSDVTLNDTADMLKNYDAIAIVSPKDSFPQSHLAQLENFLAQGKGIIIALNRVDVDLNNQQPSMVINTGLEKWLSQKGIAVHDNFVLDQKCVPIGIQQQSMTPFGPAMVTRQVEFPYFPLIQKFNSDHPITAGLEQMAFQFVSNITFSGDSSVVFVPIISSSEKSNTQQAGSFIDIMKEWTDDDFILSNLPLAVAIEGPLSGKSISKMVVIADGDFPIVPMNQQPNPDNINLMVNSVDWLSDDTGLIELRTKAVVSRPIQDIKEGKRTFLKWFNFLLPIVLILIYGIIRLQIKQRIRIKRMEAGYV